MWELIILGGILTLFWAIVRLGGNYLLFRRQKPNAHFAQSYTASLHGSLYNTDHIRRSPLTGATEYYKTVQKFNAEYYKAEKLDDLVISRYKSGKKLSEEHYKEGKLDGLHVWWYPNGNKMFEKYYKNGKETKRDLGVKKLRADKKM